MCWLIKKTTETTIEKEPAAVLDMAFGATMKDLELNLTLKKEQRMARKSFIKQNDVFVVMPVGYGKSLIYRLALWVGKWMGLSHNPMVIAKIIEHSAFTLSGDGSFTTVSTNYVASLGRQPFIPLPLPMEILQTLQFSAFAGLVLCIFSVWKDVLPVSGKKNFGDTLDQGRHINH